MATGIKIDAAKISTVIIDEADEWVTKLAAHLSHNQLTGFYEVLQCFRVHLFTGTASPFLVRLLEWLPAHFVAESFRIKFPSRFTISTPHSQDFRIDFISANTPEERDANFLQQVRKRAFRQPVLVFSELGAAEMHSKLMEAWLENTLVISVETPKKVDEIRVAH